MFDKISFVRKGTKSEEKPKFSFEIICTDNINEDTIYKVTLILYAEKKDEYEIEISLSGFFNVNRGVANDNTDIIDLLSKNTVAILMPYIRSELSLLTAQPEMECIVMPPINVKAMIENARQVK